MCKKIKIINHDCLPILMLLYIMLYIMLAYLMMFAALSNVVCLYNAIFANAFCFHALSWFINKYFVYLKHDIGSFTVPLICWFSLILCSHCFLLCERVMCSLEKLHLKITIIIINVFI